MRLWCAAGGSVDGFWHATPRELETFIRAAHDRRIYDHNVAIKAAYWGARWGREKTMTDPAKVMLEESGQPAEEGKADAQTDEDMAAAMQAWAKAMPDVFTFKVIKKRKRRRLRDSAK